MNYSTLEFGGRWMWCPNLTVSFASRLFLEANNILLKRFNLLEFCHFSLNIFNLNIVFKLLVVGGVSNDRLNRFSRLIAEVCLWANGKKNCADFSTAQRYCLLKKKLTILGHFKTRIDNLQLLWGEFYIHE